MKFRFKMALCMLGLLSLLFGIGGSLLISASFHASLKQEENAAYSAYQMVLDTLQIINRANSQSGYEDIANTVEQLAGQKSGVWTAIQLSTAEKTLYRYGDTGLSASGSPAPPDSCVIRYLPSGGNRKFLALSGTLEAGGKPLYLELTRDITPLFLARQQQIQAYGWVFLLLTVLCAVLSYSISRVLTNPLTNLSRVSQAITAGNLSSRVHSRSEDEVGLLARDFNAMATALEQNISQLKDSVERQERFMGSFAHEAKTPMTSIIGYADLLRGQTLTQEEQLEAADFIFSEGKRLENLSQKLLHIMVLKKTELKLSPVSPAALIGGLVSRLSPLYARQGIILEAKCESGVCLLEPDLIKSMLTNLFDNARKAMEGRDGSIRCISTLLPDGCRIVVQDNGPGIPPAALEHLTEAFYRVDKSRAREQGGVGLGLSLCSEIAALHGGKIRFASETGKGTSVTVELKGGAV